MRASLVAVLAFALTGTAVDPPHVKLVVVKPGEPAVVDVVGIDNATLVALRELKWTQEDWSNYCKVVVAEGKPEEIGARPGVAGTWSLTADAIRFEPQFKFLPGVKYLITCRLQDAPQLKFKAAGFTGLLLIPKPPPGPPTSVTAVFPSANVLPENALRFYVHFSGPMARGDIYRHIKLIRDDGTEVPSPFLELDEELWALDENRVTIFFHPGRVKRGLEPRETVGPILEVGRSYTLVIDRKWEDAEGKPLVSESRKTFRAGPPDDLPVDPRAWTLIPPRAGFDGPLIVRLAKPHDRALLESHMWIEDAAGTRLPTRVAVGGGERVVTFAPVKPWTKGEYKLVIDTRLEDVCGNRVGKPFEVDVFDTIQRKIETKTVERPFTVR